MHIITYIFILILSGCQLIDAQFEDARCVCICLDHDSTGHQKKKEWIDIVQAVECVCETILKENSALCPNCKCQYQVRNTNIMKIVICMVVAVITSLTLYMIILQLLEKRLGNLNARRERHNSDEKDVTSPSSGYQRFSSSMEMHPAQNLPLENVVTESGEVAPNGARGYSRLTNDANSSQVLERAFRGLEDAPPSPLPGEMGRLEFLQPSSSISASAAGTEEHPRDGVTISSPSAMGGSRPRSRSDAVSDALGRARDQQKRWQGSVQVQRARVFDEHTMLN